MNFRIAAGRGGVYGCRDLFAVYAYYRPLRSSQDHKGYSPPSKFLLKAHVLVCGENYIETGSFRFNQQVSVSERVPTKLPRFGHRVASKKPANASGRYMVKENAHRQGILRQGVAAGQGCVRQIPVRSESVPASGQTAR